MEWREDKPCQGGWVDPWDGEKTNLVRVGGYIRGMERRQTLSGWMGRSVGWGGDTGLGIERLLVRIPLKEATVSPNFRIVVYVCIQCACFVSYSACVRFD